MSGTVVITLPADSIEWGGLQAISGGGSCQQGTVFQGGKPVCVVQVVWAMCPPEHPVACSFTPRQAGPND